jgi:hypothetical protein
MQTHTDSTKGHAAKVADDDGGGIDWRLQLMTRWQAIGLQIFGIDGKDKATLGELLDECAEVIAVWVLVQTHGNITHAALWLRATRRRIRRYLLAWRKRHPGLVPPPHDLSMPKAEGDRA